jgi:peptidyl-prolyl cis-trans isomerase C
MNRRLFVICGSYLLTSLVLGCGLFDGQEKKVVIVVGSRAISVHQFKKDLVFVSAGMGLSGKKGGQARNQLVEQIIDHYLIIEHAEEKGISVSDEELERALNEIKGEYAGEDFHKSLLRGDVDFEEWKRRLREQLLINKVLKELTEGIDPPSHEDIKGYFEANREQFSSSRMVRFRQILTRTREEADGLSKRLQDGEDMGELARKYSIAPEAELGGEVGWVALEHLDESMEKALSSLPPGKISPVLNTPYGYHIFELLEVRPERVKELPEVIQEIESILLGQRREAFYKNWLQELRAHFQVKVNQDLINKLELS